MVVFSRFSFKKPFDWEGMIFMLVILAHLADL